VGLRPIFIAGSMFVPLGVLFFVLLTPHGSPVTAAVGSLVTGFGMGLASVSSLVLIQEIVDTDQRGSATASNLFSRNLGSTLGATAFGAALNYGLSHSTLSKAITSEQLRQLLDARRLAEALGRDRHYQGAGRRHGTVRPVLWERPRLPAHRIVAVVRQMTRVANRLGAARLEAEARRGLVAILDEGRAGALAAVTVLAQRRRGQQGARKQGQARDSPAE